MKPFVVRISDTENPGHVIVLDLICARYAEDALQRALSRHNTKLAQFGADRCFGIPKVLGMDYFHSTRDHFDYIAYDFASLVAPHRGQHGPEFDEVINALTGQNVTPESFMANRVKALKMLRRWFADGIPEPNK